ncbi:hypothetical protein [Syntrophotalea acetylenivorans]|uniref:hypothetical protein n=1 Tax=Syntrophotalea acetylenivorans TaxID=1842532 RepID=UPI000AA7F670|nr:hypothetical protein [Syntrophotalea acetylenivorans]
MGPFSFDYFSLYRRKKSNTPGRAGPAKFCFLKGFAKNGLINTGGSRPARRLPFCPGGNKKEAKSAFPLRGACVPAGKEKAKNGWLS